MKEDEKGQFDGYFGSRFRRYQVDEGLVYKIDKTVSDFLAQNMAVSNWNSLVEVSETIVTYPINVLIVRGGRSSLRTK